MRLNNLPTLFAVSLLLLSCSQSATKRGPSQPAPAPGELETSAASTTVQTVSGPVAGYIDGGVYIYKGIP